MIEAINKEYTLPASLLTLILNSNPHAAKSSRIQEKLDERAVPLADYQRAMIDEGLQLVSYKEGLEARESYYKTRYNFLLNQIIFEIFADTTRLDKISAIISAIDGYETVDHYYLIIDLYLKAGKITEAQNWLNAIGTDFNLDPRRDAEYADFIAVYGILFDHAATGDTTLTQNEQNTLNTIAYKHSTLAASIAKVTLFGYTGILFLEVLVKPEFGGTPKSMNHPSKAPEIKECKVYPNPTAGVLLIEIPDDYVEVQAIVRNESGKVIRNEVLSSGMATLNLRALASGSYTLYLHSEVGDLKEIHQIQIAK